MAVAKVLLDFALRALSCCQGGATFVTGAVVSSTGGAPTEDELWIFVRGLVLGDAATERLMLCVGELASGDEATAEAKGVVHCGLGLASGDLAA